MVTVRTSGVQATPCIQQQKMQLHCGPDGAIPTSTHTPHRDLGQAGASLGSLFLRGFGDVTSIQGTSRGPGQQHWVWSGCGETVFPLHVSAGSTPRVGGARHPGRLPEIPGQEPLSTSFYYYKCTFCFGVCLPTDPGASASPPHSLNSGPWKCPVGWNCLQIGPNCMNKKVWLRMIF